MFLTIFSESLDPVLIQESIEGYIETWINLGKKVPKDNDVLGYTVSVVAHALTPYCNSSKACQGFRESWIQADTGQREPLLLSGAIYLIQTRSHPSLHMAVCEGAVP